ncbi:MAG: hypothetical protein V1777_04895 [Candidatus Micrarchaeota archaeon]
MRKIAILFLLAMVIPASFALPLVVSDIQLFQTSVATPVRAVSIATLERVDVIVKDIGNGMGCTPIAQVWLDINNADTGVTALSSPIPKIVSFTAPTVPNGTATVQFLKGALNLPTSTPLDNYRIQATVYCNGNSVHQSAAVITIISSSGPASVPEIPFGFGIGIALASCALLFGYFSPNFRIKKS